MFFQEYNYTKIVLPSKTGVGLWMLEWES